MNYTYYLFILFGFLAVVLALEGGYLTWNSYKGPEAARMARRLRTISAGGHGTPTASLMRERVFSEMPALDRLLLQLPRLHQLDRLLQQAGSGQTVARFVMVSLVVACLAYLVPMLLRLPWFVSLAVAAMAGALPLLRLLAARRKRLLALEEQLPDALDLISRALRAGHAFSGALDMVATESSEPIAGEFRITFDEINFGIPAQDALVNLATRVPSTDLRFFVIAVLLQRDTGGNLAEILGNLSALIRARFKLLGTIRVLSAEGRLSAWILSLLPFCVAGVINIVNPKFMNVLFTDPIGPKLIGGALVLMAAGIYWMRRIVKIRV